MGPDKRSTWHTHTFVFRRTILLFKPCAPHYRPLEIGIWESVGVVRSEYLAGHLNNAVIPAIKQQTLLHFDKAFKTEPLGTHGVCDRKLRETTRGEWKKMKSRGSQSRCRFTHIWSFRTPVRQFLCSSVTSLGPTWLFPTDLDWERDVCKSEDTFCSAKPWIALIVIVKS